jgi:hypothetical protein
VAFLALFFKSKCVIMYCMPTAQVQLQAQWLPVKRAKGAQVTPPDKASLAPKNSGALLAQTPRSQRFLDANKERVGAKINELTDRVIRAIDSDAFEIGLTQQPSEVWDFLAQPLDNHRAILV